MRPPRAPSHLRGDQSSGRTLTRTTLPFHLNPLVCIGFSEALSAPEVAWSLIDAGFEVVAFARRGRRSALRHSSRIRVHEITAPEVDCVQCRTDLSQLLETLGQMGRSLLLFPLDDTAVWLCNQLVLNPAVRLVGPCGPNVDLALNKRLQVEAALKAGLKVPATTIATVRQQVLDRRAELPLVLRPADAVLFERGRLRKGRNWICATETELQRAVDDWAEAVPLLVQPFIDGVGEGVFGLATSNGVLGWSAHRRVRMMNPHGSGSSACVSQVVPDSVKQCVEKMIRETGWLGLFMVELLCDAAGNHWFVEFNGRPWGSMALACNQGLEYPAWAASRVLNPTFQINVPISRKRPIICRNVGREMMHLLFVLRGPKSGALHRWPSFWRTLFDLMNIGPRDSLYNWRRDDLRVFFSDVWYTLRSNLRKSSG